MGLDIYLYDGKERVDSESEKYPEHISSKGYLRSSYNSGGFNSVVNKLIGKELYYILNPIEEEEPEEDSEDDFNYFAPLYSKKHLEEALVRAKEVAEELKNTPRFHVKTVSACDFFTRDQHTPIQTIQAHEAFQSFKEALEGKAEFEGFFSKEPLDMYAFIEGASTNGEGAVHAILKDEIGLHAMTTTAAFTPSSSATFEKALAIYKEHEEKGNGYAYSCRDGSFYLDNPLKVQGVIAGIDSLGTPSVHYIHLASEESFEYYLQMSEIIIEFIELALTLKEPRIGWSA